MHIAMSGINLSHKEVLRIKANNSLGHHILRNHLSISCGADDGKVSGGLLLSIAAWKGSESMDQECRCRVNCIYMKIIKEVSIKYAEKVKG